jgi:excisionase family DNA binding protein
MPQLVEAAEPTEVAEASTRPRRPRSPEPADDISDGDAAALWKRLPRHIQLLVGMTPETREEPAQKYYSRGFKESRQQLIERLLDPTMTLEDTARVLGVCPTTVRRYTNRGVLPHYRTLGQQRRFRLSDVLAFLEKQQKQALKRRKMLFGENA